MNRRFPQAVRFAMAALVCAIAPPLLAVSPSESVVADRLVFQQPELQVSELSYPADRLTDPDQRARVTHLGSTARLAHVDLRTGRFTTLMPGTPLLPGSGVGNRLSWATAGLAAPRSVTDLQQQAWAAFRVWLNQNSGLLQINPQELVDARVTVIAPDFIQIWAPRTVAGMPVRGSFITGAIKYGNLVLVGTGNWGDIVESPVARLSEAEAADALARRSAPYSLGSRWKASELAWQPVATATSLAQEDLGTGLAHRLVWVIRTDFGEAGGLYEALVDASNGDVLSIQDTKHYVATNRVVEGGAYPVSNDNVAPDGVEVPDTPMPFSSVTTPSGTVTTDLGGNLPICVDGNITSTLAGPFLAMNDSCGAISLTSTGDLDFGTSAGTDCTTPGIGGVGNTHASRSGYAEISMIKHMARSHLPNNTWLPQQLTSNMNILNTCNASWNGAQVNFFRSGGGCFNTGELAGVFDHEWGHGMDNNDAVPTVSSPGEGIADIYASLRLDDSCIGRHFRATNCSGYGNACTMCSGVRDIDWAKRVNNTPFVMANADACGPGNSNGPCGGSVHCEGQIYSQSVWDLWNRDLVAGTFNYSLDVARELATQLTYRGASGVTSWFSCTPGSGGCGNPAGCGCAATNGYQQYLLADDDNGTLADGTPHMQAIFDAFNRHGIACGTPTVTTAGCSGTPTEIPVVSATGRDRGVALSWTASTGATNYRVYRTDGVFGCSFGKQLVATVNGLNFTDSGLKNGRNYYYQVVPMGSNDECFQVASTCTTGTPTAGANLSLVAAQAALDITTGDQDPFLDNCETAQVTVPISNIGNITQNNLRIVNVTSPSHPGITFNTTFPATVAATFSSCDTANATFEFIASGITAGQTLTFDLEVTSDELGVDSRFATVSFTTVEGDIQQLASKTFNFDTDAEGWTTTAGTFVRSNSGGGASATPFYFQSSANLDNQCDVVLSPVLRLSTTSTMELFNFFGIEPFSAQWWDRANIGLRPVGSAVRTVVSPSSGRTYNASGIGGTCGTENQPGWAASQASWGAANWTATALQSVTFADQLVQLEVRYGTDSSVNGLGFRFDQLTLTNVGIQAPDTIGDIACENFPLFADGFEAGNTAAWSLTVP